MEEHQPTLRVQGQSRSLADVGRQLKCEAQLKSLANQVPLSFSNLSILVRLLRAHRRHFGVRRFDALAKLAHGRCWHLRLLVLEPGQRTLQVVHFA
jgi:hypothetical protein